MILSMGVDISKKKADITIYNDVVKKNYVITNSVSSIKRFLKKHSDVDRIVMEATGTYYLKFATIANELGFYVSVVNPYIIKKYGEYKFKRSKTDKIDAELIAKYGYENTPKKYKITDKLRLKLKSLLTTITGLKKQITQNTNRIEALSQFPNNETKYSIKALQKVIKAIKREKSNIEKEIQAIIKNNFKKTYELLDGIKGLGPGCNAAIIAYYGDFSDFDSAKKAVAFAGMDPIKHESGSSVRKKSKISKRGNKVLRALLYMGGMSAIQYNKQCIKLNKRLKDKGKIGKVRIMASAHKLLRLAYGVVTSGVKYDPDYLKKSA